MANQNLVTIPSTSLWQAGLLNCDKSPCGSKRLPLTAAPLAFRSYTYRPREAARLSTLEETLLGR